MIYITGDTHGEFDRISEFCAKNSTTRGDILIILGDTGINFYLDDFDRRVKRELSSLPITLFCVHGNHEERPYMIDAYTEIEWQGGVVYREEEFPNLLFAKDGEIYDLDGKSAVVIGGAYSIDKYYRLSHRLPWFETEQPTDEIKNYVERQLNGVGWRVDYVFTHTAPRQYEPVWRFDPNVDQDSVDKTTEDWLDTIEKRLDYGKWYCGHYHVDTQIGLVRLMFTDIEELKKSALESFLIFEEFTEHINKRLGRTDNKT